MRTHIIESIIATKEPIEASITSFLQTVSALRTDEDVDFGPHNIIPDADGSFNDTITRLNLLIANLKVLEKVKQPEILPLKQLKNTLAWGKHVKTRLDNMSGALAPFTEKDAIVQAFDETSLTFTGADGNTVTILDDAKKFNDSVEEMLWLFCLLTPSVRARGSVDFTATSEALTNVYNDLRSGYNEIREGLASVTSNSDGLKKSIDAITQEADEIKRIKAEMANERKSASEYLAEITNNRSSIKEVHEEAVSLKNSVVEYKGTFDAFQKSVDNRNAAFEAGNSRLKDLIQKFEQREKNIEAIEIKAEDMLSSSTVAGLASHFLKLRNELTTELSATQETFRKGIIFLAASAIPLLLFVLHPVLSPLYAKLLSANVEQIMSSFNASTHDKWGYLGQTIGRLTLLIPAVWFVSFTAIRYSSLFRLREHYAYKYSMAAAVEGFKHQAPEYQEEIAAMVLEQLAFNPVDKLIPSKEIKEGKVPNIGRFLYEKLTEKTKAGAGKTAE